MREEQDSVQIYMKLVNFKLGNKVTHLNICIFLLLLYISCVCKYIKIRAPVYVFMYMYLFFIYVDPLHFILRSTPVSVSQNWKALR